MADQFWTNAFLNDTKNYLNSGPPPGVEAPNKNFSVAAGTLEQLIRIADALERENDGTLPMHCEGCGDVTDHEPVVRFGRVAHFVCRQCTWHKPLDCG